MASPDQPGRQITRRLAVLLHDESGELGELNIGFLMPGDVDETRWPKSVPMLPKMISLDVRYRNGFMGCEVFRESSPRT